jgi:DNA helicase IV
MASRTVLVKGLEYDHVIIADLAKFTDPRDLYVALSRARKSITVIGQSSRITLHF